MKTAELEGARLDYYVALSEGEQPYYTSRAEAPNAWERGDHLAWLKHGESGSAKHVPKYSRDWSHGGPVIEREHISIEPMTATLWCAEKWTGAEGTRENSFAMAYGATPLLAAMRCYVAAKFGPEVPDTET